MISRTAIFFTLFILLFFYSAAGADTSSSGRSGALIRTIEVEGLSRIKKDELLMLIPFRVGDVLDPAELRTGIRRALKKGIFLDIRAESWPYDGGIRLKYTVKEVPVITQVRVRGNRNISARNIIKLLTMKEGDDLREESLEKARSGLHDLYYRKGFHEAEISISVVKAKRARAVIKIYIKEGRPYTIEKIIAPEEARMHLPLLKGNILDLDVLDPAMEKIKRSYKEKGHIRPLVGPYEIKDGVLTIPVDPGPVLKLYFNGNSVISQGSLKKEVTFLDDEEVSDDIIEEVAENIKKLYLSRGYYYARIAAGIEYREGTTKVTFYIFEGQQVKLTKIDFAGMSISPGSIKKILPLKEGVIYDENLLAGSKDALTGFYNALGYLRMEVTDVVRKFHNNGAEIMLEFVINEGPQTRIREIKIEGSDGIAADMIKEELRLSEGSPYNMTDIGDARYRVLSLYGRRGYPDALVDVESRIDGENALLVFRITEKSPAVIGKIIVRGNRKAKTEVVSREFRAKEGDLYNYDEMLNVRQRLYNLGLFNEVAIEMADTGRKADGRDIRDVLVSLKEGNAGSVELGIGYGDYEKARGSFDITYRNVGGYNRQV
ncbi:MAG: hypothetical protein OEU95_06965, partial [Nitrospirota bacterium]|nr:hypothetical protein [Nitrospirota bacterium]